MSSSPPDGSLTSGPIQNSPKNCSAKPDPKNPLKLTISLKRKPSESDSEIPEKKSKMGDPASKNDLIELVKRFTEVVDKRLEEQEAKLDDKFAEVNDKIDTIDVKKHVIEISKDITHLKEFANQVQVD